MGLHDIKYYILVRFCDVIGNNLWTWLLLKLMIGSPFSACAAGLSVSLNTGEEANWNVLPSRSNRSIVEDIRRGEGKIYGAELLKDLLKLLPDAEEVCVC